MWPFRGHPWSVYVVRDGKELVAFAHVDRPIAALGYLGSMLTDLGNPSANYEFGLNFNWRHQYRKISLSDFDEEGNPTEQLWDNLIKIDPRIMERRSFSRSKIYQLEFYEARNKKRVDYDQLIKQLYYFYADE